MIQVHVIMTCKSYSPKDSYRIFAEDKRTFADMAEARQWLREQYGKAKRSPMYVDTKDGRMLNIGYVIGFRAADWSHSSVDKWLQRDWVSFSEVIPVDLQTDGAK